MMNIHHYRPVQQTQAKLSQPKFSGYAALPLRALVLQPDKNHHNEDVARHLDWIGEQEGFETLVHLKNKLVPASTSLFTKHSKKAPLIKKGQKNRWGQDRLSIVETPSGVTVYCRPDDPKIGKSFAKKADLPNRVTHSEWQGGNYFWGLRDDDTPYLIIGQEDILGAIEQRARGQLKTFLYDEAKAFSSDREHDTYLQQDLISKVNRQHPAHRLLYKALSETIQRLADEFHVAPENVIILPQPEFHIDLMVRPLQGNRVLVQDFTLSYPFLEQLSRTGTTRAERKLYRKTQEYEAYLKSRGFTSPDEVAKRLSRKGFDVIRVPGIASKNGTSCIANYLNSTIHEKDGSLIYITNKSPYPALNNYFAENLLPLLPDGSKIYMVSGKETKDTNFISEGLEKLEGGIHCMAAEWPDFEKIRARRFEEFA